MKTIILGTAIKILIPVFLVFSAYIFFRGHDEPGGGFIAALVTSIGFIFHMIAFGVEETKSIYKIGTINLMGVGLGFALMAGILPFFRGKTYFNALWPNTQLPFIEKIGTPILFDAGVYLLVVGVVLRIAFTLFEE